MLLHSSYQASNILIFMVIGLNNSETRPLLLLILYFHFVSILAASRCVKSELIWAPSHLISSSYIVQIAASWLIIKRVWLWKKERERGKEIWNLEFLNFSISILERSSSSTQHIVLIREEQLFSRSLQLEKTSFFPSISFHTFK